MNNYITIKPSQFLYNLAVQGFLNFVNASKRGKIAVGEINSCQSEIILEGGNVKIDFLSILQNYDSRSEVQFSDFEELKTYVAQYFGKVPELQDKYVFAYFIRDFLCAYSRISGSTGKKDKPEENPTLVKCHDGCFAVGKLLQNFFQPNKNMDFKNQWSMFLEGFFYCLMDKTSKSKVLDGRPKCVFCGDEVIDYRVDFKRHYYLNSIFCSPLLNSKKFPNGFWNYSKKENKENFAHSRAVCKLCQFILMFQRFGFSDYVLKAYPKVTGSGGADIRLFLDANNLELNFKLNKILSDGLKLMASKNLSEVTVFQYIVPLIATVRGVINIITLNEVKSEKESSKKKEVFDLIRIEDKDLRALLLPTKYVKLCDILRQGYSRNGAVQQTAQTKKTELDNKKLSEFINELFALIGMPFNKLIADKVYPKLRAKLTESSQFAGANNQLSATTYLELWETFNT